MGSAEKFAALFQGSAGAHGTHAEPTPHDTKEGKWVINTTAKTLKGEATIGHWEQHLDGKRPLGVVPVREDGTCLWGAIDVDAYGTTHAELIEKLYAGKWPLVPCRSKSGGLHLFLFLAAPTPAAVVQSVLGDVARQLGLDGVEIFPKQTRVGDDAPGNWICMPYLGTTFDGRLSDQHGIRRDGKDMTPAQFIKAGEKARVGPDALALVGKKTSGTVPDADPLARAPECMRRLCLEGISNLRNEWLFNLGVYARERFPGTEWKDRLVEFNQAYMRPPLPFEEVKMVVGSLSKKSSYEYKRDGATVCKNCESLSCPQRTKAGKPVIERLVILEPEHDPGESIEEAVWQMTLAEGQVVVMSSNDVLTQDRFNRLCIAQIRRAFPMLKKNDWIDFINEAASRAEVVQTARSASKDEQFKDMLHEFLTNRQKGDRREDLLGGKPWQDEEAGVHYFRMKDFKSYLKREDSALKMDSQIVLGRHVRSAGGDYRELKVSGRMVPCWWVPSGAFQRLPEPVPAPPVPVPM